MDIATGLRRVLANLPEGVRLVAVSKFHPNEAIEEAYRAGQRVFGENKVQELLQKQATLPQDIEWHFIGHLQTNKVRQIIPFIALIHGVDSFKLLAEIDKHAAKAGRSVNCLLQIHIAREETKFGFSVDECRAMLAAGAWKSLRFINLCGVMAMASNTDDEAQVRQEYHSLYTFFREMKTAHFPDSPAFREISMGMSHDYLLAVAEGSTLVRIGSSIFGERSYQ